MKFDELMVDRSYNSFVGNVVKDDYDGKGFNMLVEITKNMLDETQFKIFCKEIIGKTYDEHIKSAKQEIKYIVSEQYYNDMKNFLTDDFDKMGEEEKEILKSIEKNINNCKKQIIIEI